jgi:hypothetical protein
MKFAMNNKLYIMVYGGWFLMLHNDSEVIRAFNPNCGIFVTHFLFGHHLGGLHYSVVSTLVGLSDFTLFPLLSSRGLCSCITALVGQLPILHSLIYYHDWKVLLHAVNVQHGTPGFTSLLKEVVLWTFIALKNPPTSARFEPGNLGSNGKHVTTRQTKYRLWW